jgi:hypothetical protein
MILTMLSVAGVGACSPGTESTTTTSPDPATGPALTVLKGSQTRELTLDEVRSTAAEEGWGGLMTSAGSISGPFRQKGVSLVGLLESVGGVGEQDAVRIEAKDGYAMTISSRQLLEGDFTTFDCVTGKEVPHEKLTVIVAYEEDGKPIDPRIGPLRIAILGGKTQVTEGHWWIKWVKKVEVVSVFKPFTLKMEGIVDEDIDSADFESCSAPDCHGITWKDGRDRLWEGVALWRLVGKIDDDIRNRGDVFEESLADRGYEIHVISADGSVREFTAAEVKRNDNLLVAYLMNNLPLPDDSWPLRLVGIDQPDQTQIGSIAGIRLVLP